MQYTPKFRKEKLKTGIFAILDMFFFFMIYRVVKSRLTKTSFKKAVSIYFSYELNPTVLCSFYHRRSTMATGHAASFKRNNISLNLKSYFFGTSIVRMVVVTLQSFQNEKQSVTE